MTILRPFDHPPPAFGPHLPGAAGAGTAVMGLHAGFARLVPDALAARGLAADSLWHAMGLSPEQAEQDVRVPIGALSRTLQQASRLTGDPLIALEAAQAVRPAHLGSLGYALMSSTLGEDGLAMYERFQILVCNEMLTRHRVTNGLIEVRHEPVLDGAMPREPLFWWFMLSARLHFARWVSGRALVPVRIDIPAPRPALAESFARFTGCEVRYDTPDAREIMPAEWLSWLNPNADPHLHALMEARTARQLSVKACSKANDTLLTRLRMALSAHLKAGLDTGMDAMIGALSADGAGAVTTRRLQKRLAEHGLTYKSLVEEVRRDRALRLLRETDQGMLAIAHECGYAELSPFHRAVRRWTGLTPAQVRQQALQQS